MVRHEGLIVAGRYQLDRRLGAGGMGEVWSATQTVTRKPVAVKFLNDEDDLGTRRRFLREARAACAVRHPNVVQIHDVVELDGGAPAIVMELLRGESLEAKLDRDGRMPLGECAAVMARVVAAVGAAHAVGVVHRDLKPDNIFLADTPEGVDVKVLDFGIAKLTGLDGDAAQTGGLTNTGTMLGTPHYMSPEQAFGEQQIDHRADIWALGIILYRSLSGVLPTRADNIGQILKIILTRSIPPLGAAAPDLPTEITTLVDRMLEPEAADRPADLREVKAILERYAGVEVAAFDAPAPSLTEATAQTTSRATAAPRRRLGAASILLAGVALAALVATAGVTLGGARKGSVPATIAPAAGATAGGAPTDAPADPTRPGPAPPAPSAESAPPFASAAISAPAGAKRATPQPATARASTTAPAPAPAPAKSAAPSLGGVIEKPNF